MKLYKYVLPLFALLLTTTLFAQIETDTEEIESEPFEELEEAERRAAAEAAKGGISVTADIRLKWIPQLKNNLGYHTRGEPAVNPVQVDGGIPLVTTAPVATPLKAPSNYFQAEGNIYFDYDGGRDWAETQFQFKTTMGVESSGVTGVNVRKAWVGYSFYRGCNNSDLYVELGRKGMSNIFDSRIQYDSSFDGILLNYDTETCIGPFKTEAGPCIVDYRDSHYAWAGEAFLDEIMDTGFFAKYSFVHWRKKGADRYGVLDSPKYRFVNSQFMLGYDFVPDYWGFEGKEGAIYGAWLINHAAKKVVTSNWTRANQGWYICLVYGKIGKTGDYLFDICYQEVGYQAVPNFDSAGIGRGNSTARGDYACTADPTDPGNYVDPQSVNVVPASQAEGNSNYRGVEFRSYYSVTDHALIRATSSYSVAKDKNIGGKNRFVKFDLQVVYDF
ncbi:MAG: hypothetical protein P4L16_03170 [Chlamydiales bacterium]|nr:hypothetical protein [Chlamydiales bacterium]